MIIAPAQFASGANPLLVIRGTSFTNTFNSTITLPLPTGSVAGDRMVLFAGHAYDPTSPSGWTVLDHQAGSFYNGGVYTKILTSGDISTGSVTVNFAGAYNGILMGVTFIGAMGGIRSTTMIRDGNAGALSSQTVSTGAGPQAGDYALYLGGLRNGGTGGITCPPGTGLISSTTSESAGVAAIDALAVTASVSVTYGFGTVYEGSYCGIVIVQP